MSTFPADAEQLPAAAKMVLDAAREAGVGARLGDVDLVFEECFTNACSRSGAADISVACRTDGQTFLIELRDSGKPFDPAAHLAKKLSDGAAYRREGADNVLTVSFRC